jgi:hypothetical protein
VSIKPDKPAPEGGDIFAHIARTRGPLPPGEYAAEFVIHHPFGTPETKTRGAIAFIKITEREWRGRQIELRFVQEAPSWLDGVIVRDADALMTWRQAVGAEGSAPDFDGALKQIWKAGRDKRLLFRIGVTPPRAGTTVGEMFLAGARLDDRYDF